MRKRAPLYLVGATFLMALLAITPAWVVQSESSKPDVNMADQRVSADISYLSKEELGKYLFFDRRLSGDGLRSCATCHQPENSWTDGVALAGLDAGPLYFRNTPTLLNAGQMPVFDWDGRFAQGDLSSAVRDHIAEAHFMNIDGRMAIERVRQVPEYEAAFAEVLGSEVSYGGILGSLASFVESLNSQDNPYQLYLGGDTLALTPEATQGLELFQDKGNCAQCHSGPLLSDGQMYALGVPENSDVFREPLRHVTFRRFFRGFGIDQYANMRQDPGLFALTLDEADRAKFRTPSLLEVGATAPYMHNGVFDSLEDVVEFYNQGGGYAPNKHPSLEPLGLTAAETASLAAFLESLRSPSMPFEQPTLPEYMPRKLGDN